MLKQQSTDSEQLLEDVMGIEGQLGQPALVMPYIKMCACDELENNPLIKAAVLMLFN